MARAESGCSSITASARLRLRAVSDSVQPESAVMSAANTDMTRKTLFIQNNLGVNNLQMYEKTIKNSRIFKEKRWVCHMNCKKISVLFTLVMHTDSL